MKTINLSDLQQQLQQHQEAVNLVVFVSPT